MKISEIYAHLNELSPFELQEKWDNSGLLLGDFSQEVSQVVLSIDIDEALLDRLEENSLVITHHPIIFGGIKQMQFQEYPSNLLRKMIQKNISNIAMHTNFDQTHLNKYVAEDVLGYKIIKKDGFVAYFEVNEPFTTFAKKVGDAFGLKHIRLVQNHDFVTLVGLTTGSGASLMRSIKSSSDADCFLTGDIKYHDAMEAKTINLSMIDIGHYESECFFGQILAPYLKNLDLTVIISQSKNPFTYL
jgi:dinuclear metal center YbgI/SA1388 family protein